MEKNGAASGCEPEIEERKKRQAGNTNASHNSALPAAAGVHGLHQRFHREWEPVERPLITTSISSAPEFMVVRVSSTSPLLMRLQPTDSPNFPAGGETVKRRGYLITPRRVERLSVEQLHLSQAQTRSR